MTHSLFSTHWLQSTALLAAQIRGNVMRVATGTVVYGKVVLDGSDIADGTDVYVLTRDPDDAAALSPEELAELEAGITEANNGDMISGVAFFEHLRRHG